MVADLGPRGNGEHVLVVDDEPAIVAVLKMILENSGYRVTGHTASPRALETFKDDPGSFDMVITDHVMPELTGIRLTEEIHRLRPSVPVILCSGLNSVGDGGYVGPAGVQECLQKPIATRELLTVVRNALCGHKPGRA